MFHDPRIPLVLNDSGRIKYPLPIYSIYPPFCNKNAFSNFSKRKYLPSRLLGHWINKISKVMHLFSFSKHLHHSMQAGSCSKNSGNIVGQAHYSEYNLLSDSIAFANLAHFSIQITHYSNHVFKGKSLFQKKI